jgi:hypothetical protein
MAFPACRPGEAGFHAFGENKICSVEPTDEKSTLRILTPRPIAKESGEPCYRRSRRTRRPESNLFMTIAAVQEC